MTDPIPQTAEQINASQTGKVTLPPQPVLRPAPAPRANNKRPKVNPPQVAGKAAKPAGWWSINDLSGTRDGVTKAIQAQTDIPDRWKTVILAEITALDPKLNFIKVHAHLHIGTHPADLGRVHLTLDILPSAGLT